MLIYAEDRLFTSSDMTPCCLLQCSQGNCCTYSFRNVLTCTTRQGYWLTSRDCQITMISTYMNRSLLTGNRQASSQEQEEKQSCLSGSPCIFIIKCSECSFSCTRVKTNTGSSNCMSHSKNRGPSKLLKSSCRLDSTLGMSLTPSISTRAPLPCTQGNHLGSRPAAMQALTAWGHRGHLESA